MQNQSHWADPTVAALFAIATVVFCAVPIFAGVAPVTAFDTLIIWSAAAFFVLLPAALISMARNDYIGGIAGLLLGPLISGGFFVSGLVRMRALPVGISPEAEGWVYIAIGVMLFIMALVFLKITWTMSGSMVVGGIGFICLGIWNLGGATGIRIADGTAYISNGFAAAGAWCLFILALGFFYCATAIFLNTVFQKQVLPLGRPLAKQQAAFLMAVAIGAVKIRPRARLEKWGLQAETVWSPHDFIRLIWPYGLGFPESHLRRSRKAKAALEAGRARAEWKLICTRHNLLKLFPAGRQGTWAWPRVENLASDHKHRG